MSSEGRVRRPYDTLRRAVGPVAAPIYGAVVAAKNRRFDRGVGVRRVDLPVVSVGNLTVGGTGKTPFVMWLCRELVSRRVRPAIAMRGYKSEQNAGVSDEAEEYRRALPEVPVIVNPDRFAGISGFLAGGGSADVIVLDDGFQHRQLYRDLDIVLVDAMADTPADRLLPAGDLREPVAGIARAGVVVLTHADDEGAAAETERVLSGLLHAGAVVARASHRWRDLAVLDAGAPTTWRVEWLRRKRVAAVCGVGRPERFFQQLRALECDVVLAKALNDHQPIDAAVAQSVAQAAATRKAQIVVTTQKDFARLASTPPAWASLTIVRPVLELQVRPADAVVQRAVAAIESRRAR